MWQIIFITFDFFKIGTNCAILFIVETGKGSLYLKPSPKSFSNPTGEPRADIQV